MGLLRDLAYGTARGALEALQKAAGPPGDGDSGGGPPWAKKGAKGPPGDGPPAPPTPPPRDLPEPVQGTGPTLAAPADEDSRSPQLIGQLDGPVEDPIALQHDPFAIIDALGYKDKPTALTFQTLDSMVWRMPIIQAIIKTRLEQVSNFAEVQQDKYGIGFRVQMRDRKAAPTPVTEKRSQELERWLLTTGVTNRPQSRDSFSAFLKKIVRDTLTYDAMSWEIVPNAKGTPATFYAVDATTVRYADSTRLFTDPEDEDLIRYVQIYDGLVVAEFTDTNFCYGVRNPRTDIRMQQYGTSELEMLVNTITALLWAWDYNQKAFSQGTAAKGIINFKGAVPEKQIRNFRRQWYMMTAGVENAWRTPIVNSDDLQWVNLQANNRDMEYNAWFDFLIKVACGCYGMDPMEINFKYGDSGGQRSMFESANTSKLSASKDKGLKPLLKFLETKINHTLIWPLQEDMEFKFVGLESDTRAEQADLNTKLVKTIKTINELRKEEDMAPLPNGMGDVILDPVFMQHMTLAQQTQTQNDTAQAAQDAGGIPEDGPGDGGDDMDGELPDGAQDVDEMLSADPPEPEVPEPETEKSFRKKPPRTPFRKSFARKLRPETAILIDTEC